MLHTARRNNHVWNQTSTPPCAYRVCFVGITLASSSDLRATVTPPRRPRGLMYLTEARDVLIIRRRPLRRYHSVGGRSRRSTVHAGGGPEIAKAGARDLEGHWLCSDALSEEHVAKGEVGDRGEGEEGGEGGHCPAVVAV